MAKSKQHISLIPQMLAQKGISNIVISPGSRNAPLIKVLYNHFKNKCISLVDERSAAYFALGIALRTKKPAVIVSTSGTAALNFAPAIAEAFHQSIPLIALTADRPQEWIDMQDNQTIRQKNIYAENCKASYNLPIESNTTDDIWYTNRILNEAHNYAISEKPGPVHINIPLREPLYDSIPDTEFFQEISCSETSGFTPQENHIKNWNLAQRILIIGGQHVPDKRLNDAINTIAEQDQRVVVFAEPISNLQGDSIISRPDLLLTEYRKKPETFRPDLIISFGGQIVSKRLRTFIRNLARTKHWHISANGKHTDTFQQLNTVIKALPADFFEAIGKYAQTTNTSEYASQLKDMYQASITNLTALTANLPYSDLSVFKNLALSFKKENILFAGNSSVVRYIQFFQTVCHAIYANRGTSGIDGCLSTAAGIAHSTNKKVIAVIGDLSFVYDSNGLWNRELPPNLKIIVINNKGGGIFSLIPGPAEQEAFEELIEAYHPVDISKLASAFGIEHYLVEDINQLDATYKAFCQTSVCSILEIKTPKEANAKVFNNFIKHI